MEGYNGEEISENEWDAMELDDQLQEYAREHDCPKEVDGDCPVEGLFND